MYFFKVFVLGIKTLCYCLMSFVEYFFIGLINIITIIPRYIIKGIRAISGKKNKTEVAKEKDTVSLAILCISFSIYLICVFLGSRWYVQGLKIKYLSQDIVNSTEIIEEVEGDNSGSLDSVTNNDVNDNNETSNSYNDNSTYYPNDYWDYLSVPFIDVNFEELLEKNNDTVGWIMVEGTKVNYPIVQTNDNDYYLDHAFNKSSNIGGWIFADYRSDLENFGRNTIIYGHNMNNKTMFGSIPSMLKDSYLNNSDTNYIKISTPSSNSVWKVFSVYSIEPEVYYLKTNFKDEPFERFLNTLKDRSIYNFGTEVTSNDKIITLSTCDDTGTKRIVVHAKMINIEYK